MTAAPQHPAAQESKSKFSGLAWACLILGIIGICGSPLPLLNNLTAVAAFVGLILGIIALFGTKKVVAGIGVALCVLSIAATVALQAAMVRGINKAFEEVRSGPTEPGANAGSGQGHDPAAPSEVVRVHFGAEHSWPGGETISISEPTEYTDSNSFAPPAEGNRYVQFDVTVVNNGNDDYNVMESTISAQHNGRVAEQNFAAGGQFPNAQIPPGDDVTYTMVFEIGKAPGELQVSVQPNMFAAGTVYFTGRV